MPQIGIICGSQRTPRAGDQITNFVHSTVQQVSSNTTIHLIDIAALSLPFFNEPGIPSKILSPEDYTHQHTRAWSRQVSALDGFVFVTPQYNWGIPAGLKNAIDYLFHEWKGKPAVIVSYGGHGGDKAARALKLCLEGGIGMQIKEEMVVNLAFPSREVLKKAARGEDLELDGSDIWVNEKADIIAAWEEMLRLLG